MELEFFTSAVGRSYVQDFLNTLPDTDRAAIVAVFVDIEEHGFSARGCTFRQIERKLWEIRIPLKSGGYRFFYIMVGSNQMLILHAYKKQGAKAPPREIKMAKKRMKEVNG